MNWHSEADIGIQLKLMSRELKALKGQIERQAQSFEALMTRMAKLQSVGKPAAPANDLASQPKHFVAAKLPDPAMLRRVIRQRRRRAQLFPGIEFSDPAWEIMLDLAAAKAEQKRVSVSSLCLASGVPPTTALRWIAEMTKANLLIRLEDEDDRRRVYVHLTEFAERAMAHYFAAAEDALGLFA